MTFLPLLATLTIAALALEALAYTLALYWPRLVANAIELEGMDGE